MTNDPQPMQSLISKILHAVINKCQVLPYLFLLNEYHQLKHQKALECIIHPDNMINTLVSCMIPRQSIEGAGEFHSVIVTKMYSPTY
jgi:hypothetical protein